MTPPTPFPERRCDSSGVECIEILGQGEGAWLWKVLVVLFLGADRRALPSFLTLACTSSSVSSSSPESAS